MAVRIPIIEQQVGVSTGGAGIPTAQLPQGNIISSIGRVVSAVGDDMEARAKQMREDNARIWLAEKSSEARLEAQRRSIEARQSITDDGSNHPAWAINQADDIAKRLEESAPDDETREAVRLWGPQFKSQWVSSEMDWAASHATNYRESQLRMAVDNWAIAVTNDPASRDSVLNEANAYIASVKIPDYARQELQRNVYVKVTEAAALETARRAGGVDAASGLVVTSGKGTVEPVLRNDIAKPELKAFAVTTYKKKGLDPNILLAQVMAESSGNAKARGPTLVRNGEAFQSAGLTQFIPATAKQYGVNPDDPNSAIEGQAAYMADLMRQFGGDYAKALAAYNAGPGNIVKAVNKAKAAGEPDKWMDHLHPLGKKETIPYVNKILKAAGYTSGGEAVAIAGGVPPELGDVLSTLPPDSRKRIMAEYESNTARAQKEIMAKVAMDVDDHIALAMDGRVPDGAYTQSQLIAYGVSPKKAQEYAVSMSAGKYVDAVKTATVSDLNALMRNDVGGVTAGYADVAPAMERVKKAAADELKLRASDPIAAKIRAGQNLPSITPDVGALLSTISAGGDEQQAAARRIGTALAMRTSRAEQDNLTHGYGFSALAKDEAETLSRAYAAANPEQQMALLGVLRAGIRNERSYVATMDTVFGKSPTLRAAAGAMMSGDTTTARVILQGNAMMKAKTGLVDGEAVRKSWGEKLSAKEASRLQPETISMLKAGYEAAVYGLMANGASERDAEAGAQKLVLGERKRVFSENIYVPADMDVDAFEVGAQAAYAKFKPRAPVPLARTTPIRHGKGWAFLFADDLVVDDKGRPFIYEGP